MDKQIVVEILDPPTFAKTGKLIPRTEAWQKGLWYGTFNLWIVRRDPVAQIIYQQRSPTIGYAPNKLDVALAGHYENGESVEDCLKHESIEELKVTLDLKKTISLGRRLNVGQGTDGTFRNSVSDLFLVEDNRPREEFFPQQDEVFGICVLPLDELLKVHKDPNFSFKTKVRKFDGSFVETEVNQEMFPYNWDNYHFKMALLIDRYFREDKFLIY